MQTANTTSENICQAMGMDGFANDWHLASADESIRLLLMPSFAPEVCITFTKAHGAVTARVETPRDQIWLQHWPMPQKTMTDVATGASNAVEYDRLLHLFELAGNPPPGQRVVILDGMPSHCIHRKAGERVFDIRKNPAKDGPLGNFIGAAIAVAWEAIDGPRVRNALREAGTYVGVRLEKQEVPPDKPLVRTMVLGGHEDAPAILEALEKYHGHPKPGDEDQREK